MSHAVGIALRLFLRFLCWLAIGVGGCFGAIFVVMLFAPEHANDRLGAAVLLVPVAAMIAGGVWGLRRLPRFSAPVDRASGEELAGAEQRLRAGETVELHPSLRRTILLGLVCLALLGGSVAGLVAEPNVLFAIGALLFGWVSVLWAMRLIPGRVYLRISPDGLVVRGAFKTTRWRWNQIAGFVAFEISRANGGSTKMVGFDRRDVDRRRQGFWKLLNRGVSGVDVALPDTYGMRHRDLAQLLQDAHDRYATEHGPSPADLQLADELAHVRQDRLPLVTALLAVACVGVFVLEVARYGLFQDGRELYDAGAASRDALAAGRWWTLLAANVLHAGPIHLVVNLIGLVLVGWLLEREIGWAKLALLCVAGGIAATGVAVLIQPHTEVVGVSGVIFALLGWAVVRDKLRTRALGAVAYGSLVPGLVYTFFVPHVSIGAHLGGLAAGLLLGRAFERGDRAEREPTAAGAGALTGRGYVAGG